MEITYTTRDGAKLSRLMHDFLSTRKGDILSPAGARQKCIDIWGLDFPESKWEEKLEFLLYTGEAVKHFDDGKIMYFLK